MRLIIAFAVAAIVFALLERIGAALPRKPLFRRERLVDFVYWLFTPVVTRTLSSVSLFAAIALLAPPRSSWFASQSKLAQIIELLVAADFIGYWTHRAFHRGALWRIHAIHHSSRDLDWLSASRLHPLNEIITRLTQVVPLYLLGFRNDALVAIVPILTFWAVFIHANVRWDFGPLRYVIATPRFHRWHHTSEDEGLDKNFAGLFPWIDLLFGTFYMPDRQPVTFGVREEIPNGLLGQLAHPFR